MMLGIPLDQGLENFFCKGPGSNCFRLCETYCLFQLLKSAIVMQKQLQAIYK
jgi:hypothetical protein